MYAMYLLLLAIVVPFAVRCFFRSVCSSNFLCSQCADPSLKLPVICWRHSTIISFSSTSRPICAFSKLFAFVIGDVNAWTAFNKIYTEFLLLSRTRPLHDFDWITSVHLRGLGATPIGSSSPDFGSTVDLTEFVSCSGHMGSFSHSSGENGVSVCMYAFVHKIVCMIVCIYYLCLFACMRICAYVCMWICMCICHGLSRYI